MPVMINETAYTFSPGKHNALQKAILEEFAPRFAPGAICLYVGDTTNKNLVENQTLLKQLGIALTEHDKLPDVILYCKDVDWIYFVEAVTSVGPMSPKRLQELEAMTQQVTSGKIYVTAFPDVTVYKRFVADRRGGLQYFCQGLQHVHRHVFDITFLVAILFPIHKAYTVKYNV